MSQTHTFANVLTPGAYGPVFAVKARQTLAFTVVGTIDAECSIVLQRSTTAGHSWETVQTWAAGAHNVSSSVAYDRDAAYRFRAIVDLTDPASTLTSLAVSLGEAVDTVEVVKNSNGDDVLTITDEGIQSPKVTGTTVTDGSATLTGGSLALPLGSVQHSRSGTTGAIIRGFGATASEGLQEAIVEETISFAANAALFKELAYLFPANAVIVSAQANIEAALTGGGTTAKVGLGTEADPDAYGKTSALTKNAKIDTQPDAAAGFAAPTALRLSSCAADGSAGDTALTVGSVRVRIVYRALVSLADAAV